MFDLFRVYQQYWQKLRKDLDDQWNYFIEITLADGSKKSVRNDRLFIKDDSTSNEP